MESGGVNALEVSDTTKMEMTSNSLWSQYGFCLRVE